MGSPANEVGPLAAREDTRREYVPRGQGEASGWLRVGRYDRCRRRALWVRFVPVEGPPWLDEESNIAAIELCAGREGDDAFVRIEPGQATFSDLLDVMLRAADHIPARWPTQPESEE